MNNSAEDQISLVVFDDTQRLNDCLLAPLCDLRAAFDIRTGILTNLERVQRVLGLKAACLFVSEELAPLTREYHPETPVNDPSAVGSSVLLVNGRSVLDIDSLTRNLEIGTAIFRRDMARSEKVLISARVSGETAAAFLTGNQALPIKPTADVQPGTLLSRPWHVRAYRDDALTFDLMHCSIEPIREIPLGVHAFGDHPLRVAKSARILPGVVFDVSAGPIGIDEHATIRPGAVLSGPCWVGEHSTVLDRAVIRPYTVVGPWCKVAGEIGGTIFQGYSNKAHDGYLGDSYVGEWVNLGAGTTNSNLLNTYTQVIARATPSGKNERTSQTFLGCVLGDHVKTAICTRIMTGAIVNTGTMWAATNVISGCVSAFRWVTDASYSSADTLNNNIGTPFRFDKFMEVAKAAMSRRNIAPSPSMIERLRYLCENASR